ncbi:hypothetical protein EDD15DRAFT_2226667 [Pisolithus albus]|nr:hypothetical protein EDD15DRAFT_2226667 [Pisolithus albus]
MCTMYHPPSWRMCLSCNLCRRLLELTISKFSAFIEPREHDARYAQASGYMVLSSGLQVDHNSAHRLHRRNLPYPEEYRYGPERPPPPNFRSLSRASERAHTRSASSASNASTSARRVSELDKLFAKLGGVSTNGVTQSQSLPQLQRLQLRASLQMCAILRTENSRFSSDSAMSSTSHNVVANAHTPTAYSQDHHILSPKPTTSALPQVLNQEVISTLLGLPPSRASSARYEGDNEASDDGASEPGSMSSSIPQLAIPPDHVEASTKQRIMGDATPRASLRGFDSDTNQVANILTAAAYIGQRQQRAQSPHTSGAQLRVPAAKPEGSPLSVDDTSSAWKHFRQ